LGSILTDHAKGHAYATMLLRRLPSLSVYCG